MTDRQVVSYFRGRIARELLSRVKACAGEIAAGWHGGPKTAPFSDVAGFGSSAKTSAGSQASVVDVCQLIRSRD